MHHEDETLPPRKRALHLIEAVGGRKDLKRLGKWLDGAGTSLRGPLLTLARERGVDLPDEALGWPGKKLLRRALAREGEARVRTNPIARDEAFTCMHCGKAVSAHGRTARDHCPYCLSSRHVDVVPGDRANACGGRLEAVGVRGSGERTVILYRCVACGASHQNRAVLDGDPPDDWQVIVALAARAGA